MATTNSGSRLLADLPTRAIGPRPLLLPDRFLKDVAEPLPNWLRDLRPESLKSLLQHFFDSRVVFYPGAGEDGQPIKLFNESHSAHCFVYVDHAYALEKVERAFASDPSEAGSTAGIRGYRMLCLWRVASHVLLPTAPVRHFECDERQHMGFSAYFVVMQRKTEFDQRHGAERFAILFVHADGVEAYDNLFCQANSAATPFCVVVQDHGFSGNWSTFDRRGELHRLASQSRVLPRYLLVGSTCAAWTDYEQVPRVSAALGGAWVCRRYLWQRA